MINPQVGDTGKCVSYRAPYQLEKGLTTCHIEPEYGVITSWNEYYVFVRFSEDCHSKACTRESLAWDFVSMR